VFNSVKKSSEEESPKMAEPAMEQKGEVGDVEDEKELTTEEDTEVDDEGTRSRASKRLSYEM
jgi:hypothetical protein